MYLLDTNIVSEPIRPGPDARVLERMGAAAGDIAIPSLVWHELWFGAHRLEAGSRRRYIERYLSEVVAPTIPRLSYDENAARWHARERARLTATGFTPPFVDGQIAAIAAVGGLVLVTRNTADFERFDNLQLENWFVG